MATLDTLATDQRAVLQLVLGRGRSYDEIARLLSINPDSVRERALAALDALGPQTRVAEPDRQLICDYLLGQLEGSNIEAARDLLAHSVGERAWARVLSSELAPIAVRPLPEIPLDTGGAPVAAPSTASAAPAAGTTPAPVSPPAPAPAPAAEPPGWAPTPQDDPDEPAPERRRGLRRGSRGESSAPVAVKSRGADDGDGARPRSSRRGGMVILALGAAAIVVIVLLLLHHSNPKNPTAVATSTTSTTPVTSSTSGTTSTTAGGARVLAQINLAPTAAGSKAAAIADVLSEGGQREIAIVGQNVPANTKANSYAVWLYNSPSSADRLGFVTPGVSANGKLSAAGALPTNASSYKELIVTLETSAHPTKPGPIVLEGAITGL